MFVCVIAGIELVDRLAPRSAETLRQAISGWNLQPLRGGRTKPRSLLIVILALGLFMAWISVRGRHLSTIACFLSFSRNEVAKTAYRQHYCRDHGRFIYMRRP